MERTSYVFAAWLFLRAIGLAYFAAFLSFSSQVLGLIGSSGILPASRLVQAVGQAEGANGFWLVPSLFWFNQSDLALQVICWLGLIASLIVSLGLMTNLALVVCWLLWLSLVVIGQDFLSFQWDILLLEAGFLAIFLAPWMLVEPPWRLGKKPRSIAAPPVVMIWLFRWLLFRLLFCSGLVKLQSGDPTWWNLTALDYHYLTQPLPTPLAWFVSKMPELFQRASVCGVFIIELVLPFLIFAPRRLRLIAAGGFIFLQILIALTGNYAYFNLLTVALCFFLIDDACWQRILPNRLKNWFSSLTITPLWSIRQWLSVAIAILIGLMSVTSLIGDLSLPPLLQMVVAPLERFYLVNSYGLFAVMTIERNEIIVEGSDDGVNWRPYEFKFKPGDLYSSPCLVAPLQPRLDWQMWFAALAPLEHSPWFAHFIVRLFQGSPSVLGLLKTNPFPDHRPTYLRAQLYRYTFSDWQELLHGQWWCRQYIGVFAPAVSVQQLENGRR